MQVGYMVDNGKYLPDGTENPNWRKFVPFEPYAEVVRQYFRVFLECGGAIRESCASFATEASAFRPVSHLKGLR